MIYSNITQRLRRICKSDSFMIAKKARNFLCEQYFIGNTTQRPSNGFVRHMLAGFPRNRRFFKVIIAWNLLTYADMLAKTPYNLTKIQTAHLSHNLYAVLPIFYILIPVSARIFFAFPQSISSSSSAEKPKPRISLMMLFSAESVKELYLIF